MFLLALGLAFQMPPPVPADTAREFRPLCLDTIIPHLQREPDRWLGMDKFWHFSASFVTVGASYHLFENRLNAKAPLPTGLSLGGALTLGLSKEFSDLAGPNRHFCWKDLIADAAGIAAGYFAFIHPF